MNFVVTLIKAIHCKLEPTWRIQQDPAFKKSLFKTESKPVSYTRRPFLKLFSSHRSNNNTTPTFKLTLYSAFCSLTVLSLQRGLCSRNIYLPLCLISIRPQWDCETTLPKHDPAPCTMFVGI